MACENCSPFDGRQPDGDPDDSRRTVPCRRGNRGLNVGRKTIQLRVDNTGDRPVQVGSHYHFAETNPALAFDRAAARGFRLDIAAGTAVRFEPGQGRTVDLVALAGLRRVYGFRQDVMGPLDAAKAAASKRGAR